MSFSPGTRIGPYEVLSMVGAGGMGEVYRARDTRLSRDVAIKILIRSSPGDALSLTRFRREGQAVAALNHPCICPIFDVGEYAGQPFLVMELLEGETLQARLSRGPVPIEEAVFRGIALSDGLEAAHRAGLVHRDVKPANIFLTARGETKIVDFGLARIMGTADDTTHLSEHTGPGVVPGTVAYMSPEQLRGEPADRRSDLFSLGLVLYEMATGRPAFHGATTAVLSAAILHGAPTPPRALRPDVPEAFDALVMKAIEKDPELRSQSAAEMRADLKRLSRTLAEQDSSPRTAPSPHRLAPPVGAPQSRRASKRPGWLVGMAAILILVGVVAAWWLSSTRERKALSSLGLAGRVRQITRDAGLSYTPALSRDNRFIAYSSDREEAHLDVWVQQTAGGEPLRITRDPADDYDPSFSMDGATITFRSDRGAGGIYQVSTLGGREKLLVPGGRSPRVSPDGQLVAYWVGIASQGNPRAAGTARLFVIDHTGGVGRQVAADFAAARFPVWSPDGRSLIFQGARESSKPLDWCVATIDGRSSKCLNVGMHGFNPWEFERQAVSDWTNDRILFSMREGDAVDLWQVRFDVSKHEFAGAFERLTQGVGDEGSPRFGSAGQVVFADLRVSLQVWAVGLEPGNGVAVGVERRVTQVAAWEYSVNGSADRSKIAFTSDRDGSSNTWLLDLENDTEKRLTNMPRAFLPKLDSGGNRVAYLRYDDDKGEVRILSIESGRDEFICNNCGLVTSWSHDNRWLLASNAKTIRAIDVESKRVTDILEHPPLQLYSPQVSPDGETLAFVVRAPGDEGGISVTRFAGAQKVSSAEWVTVAAGPTEDKPQWSADGRLLYYISYRDGFGCLWAQPMEPRTLKRVGTPLAVYHSHRARRSIKDVPVLSFSFVPMIRDLYFVQAEKTGNVWLMERAGSAR